MSFGCSSTDLTTHDEEDVVVEGSQLHQALTNMGYSDFTSTPRVKTDYSHSETNSPSKELFKDSSTFPNDILNSIYYGFVQNNRFRKKYVETIAESEVLLDDHALQVQELLIDQQPPFYKNLFEWLPFIGSAIAVAVSYFIVNKTGVTIAVISSAVCGFSSYREIKHWLSIRALKHFIKLQNELHSLVKNSLKILRRTYGKKSIVPDVHEKNVVLGSEKKKVVVAMKQELLDIFETMSHIYYEQANDILDILPDVLQNDCLLSRIRMETGKDANEKNYEKLKSMYYAFIVVQSELLVIMATGYNSKIREEIFEAPTDKLLDIIKSLTKLLEIFRRKLSKTLKDYKQTEIQPVRRVFSGVPTSKWQDTYIHLDLTSQRIQSAFKEITAILESIDSKSEEDQNNPQLAALITEKMNNAYKFIENARSFAEFTSLLIAKAQRKAVNDPEEKEDFFPLRENNEIKPFDLSDKEPEIEDEVFEEYIREEYIKPLMESSEGIMESFKLDKLLKKNFMSELKEALIEKQKSMNERELQALTRMYKKVKRDSNINKIEPERSEEENSIARPPPAPPLLPSMVSRKSKLGETKDKDESKPRQPVPLPRVKMSYPEDEIPNVQRFSISHCIQHNPFPPYKITEETFVGSGENSEEEFEKSESESNDQSTIDN